MTAIKQGAKIPVSEGNLRSAAARLLSNRQIVSSEIQYIQQKLGATATRSQIDEIVIAVRAMPWSQVALSD